ncbi:MAG: hypothetical protein HS122_13370 [Opitutaceae bacterium]|nr:hypothetical protein [Opitutaceae bacterium]
MKRISTLPVLLGFLLPIVSLADMPVARKTLLLDSTLIKSSENIRMTVGRLTKYSGNPLFGEDRPWEPRFDNMYPNVIRDESDGLFKCWYNPFLVEVEDWLGSSNERKRWLYPRQSGLCYATSRDGIHWEKPAFDILPFWGQPSNILMRDVHGVGVFRDARDPDPARRYKAFFVNQEAGRRTTVAVAFSADGIHWGPQTVLNNVKLMADTHNNALWAPTLNRYVAFTRDWDPREWKRNSKGEIPAVRLVSRIESEDFVHWSDPQTVLRGVTDNLQVYAMPVFHYAGIYLGLPVVLDAKDDRTHTELAWSKDTVNWHRVDAGTPFIPNSEKKGDYDWGCTYPAAVPVIMKDEIRIYYSGSDGLHFGQRKAWFEFATLRPDGFAAAAPVDESREGLVQTTPVSIRSDEPLMLTADVEAGGSVQVAILDAEGREVARSVPMTGSFTSRAVRWETASRVVDGEHALKFRLVRARLYSYEFGTKRVQ